MSLRGKLMLQLALEKLKKVKGRSRSANSHSGKPVVRPVVNQMQFVPVALAVRCTKVTQYLSPPPTPTVDRGNDREPLQIMDQTNGYEPTEHRQPTSLAVFEPAPPSPIIDNNDDGEPQQMDQANGDEPTQPAPPAPVFEPSNSEDNTDGEPQQMDQANGDDPTQPAPPAPVFEPSNSEDNTDGEPQQMDQANGDEPTQPASAPTIDTATSDQCC